MILDIERPDYIAFCGSDLIARGPASAVVAEVKRIFDSTPPGAILIFDAITSEPVEWDLRGSEEDVLARFDENADITSTSLEAVDLGSYTAHTDEKVAAMETRRGPGRRKLGVVSREITLLPRHWEWLGKQPGGASVTLRKLVERARAAGAADEQKRLARESAYRFMSALAGNLAGYEEAIRALFAGDEQRFVFETSTWPEQVRAHATDLASGSFSSESTQNQEVSVNS